MTFEILFVLLALLGMVIALVLDKMRPGMVLFSVVVLFLCAGILTPKEMLEGFSNKGMMTVAMLFLVSEGIRQSGALGQVIKKLLPQGKTTVFKAQFRMLPTIAFISAFLNNTPVVVIFAPIIKRWAESVKLPATKFLIPLSYVTILGGICTLIGTSTNLVVHGMILEAGYEGFTMFELGKVGIFVAIAGILYLFAFSSRLLPDVRTDAVKLDEEPEEAEELEQEESGMTWNVADQAGFLFFCPVFGGGHGYEDKDHPGLAGRSGGTYQHAATGTAQSFGSSCRTAAAPRRDYHRRNRRRGCETHGGMRPGSWSEPSAYGTVSCIVPAGAVAYGREHGQKKEQKDTKGEGTGIPACSVSFCRNADWYLDRRLKKVKKKLLLAGIVALLAGTVVAARKKKYTETSR